MAKSKTASFKVKSPVNFVNFLNRFLPMEKSLLMELTPEALLAKSYTPDKAAIKFSSMPLVDVLEGDVPADLIKIAIYDIKKVVDSFKHFSESDEISLDLTYDDLGEDCVGVCMKFYTASLRIKIDCADISLYTYIKSAMLKKILDTVRQETILEFPFQKDAFAKVASLAKVYGGPTELMTISVEDGKIDFRGKPFDITVGELQGAKNAEITIFNRQFSYIDQEVSTFIIGLNKMVVKSQESTTIMIIAKVE